MMIVGLLNTEAEAEEIKFISKVLMVLIRTKELIKEHKIKGDM